MLGKCLCCCTMLAALFGLHHNSLCLVIPQQFILKRTAASISTRPQCFTKQLEGYAVCCLLAFRLLEIACSRFPASAGTNLCCWMQAWPAGEQDVYAALASLVHCESQAAVSAQSVLCSAVALYCVQHRKLEVRSCTGSGLLFCRC